MDNLYNSVYLERAKKNFWAKVAIKDKNDCWEWQGALVRGYGKFHFGYHSHRAHRVAWTFTNGIIPTGKLVLHKCDNLKCVNPNHLYLGTHGDNQVDTAKRYKGYQTGMPSSVTKEDILNMKYLRSKGLTYKQIAVNYQLSPGHIGNLINDKYGTNAKGGDK